MIKRMTYRSRPGVRQIEIPRTCRKDAARSNTEGQADEFGYRAAPNELPVSNGCTVREAYNRSEL